MLLKNGTVVTMDRAGRTFAPGVVVLRGDAILAVGGPELADAYEAGDVLDCAGHIVMPGLINAHTHAPMTLLRGLVDDLRLDVWLHGYMMPVERQFVTPEFCYLGALLACVEMIRGGVTCFADMYYHEDRVAAATAEAGLRAVCGETILKFPSPDAASYDESLAACRRFIAQWKGHSLIVPTVAPHAPYTCTPEILREAVQLAGEFDVPILTHLCETAQEVDDWEKEYLTTPVQWLDEQGFFAAKVVAAHCVHVDDGDMRLLARVGCTVAHNPTSNLKLASGIAPITRMQELGITVGIGTDGCASNNDLDMFEEMRLAALLPKGTTLDPTVMPARAAVAMATSEGARSLFLDPLVGSLEPGKRADLIVVDTRAAYASPHYTLTEGNLYSRLVYSAKSADVRDTIVNGRFLMRGRRILTVDEEAVLAEAQQVADRIATFVMERDRNLVDKLVALGEVEQEETFEVQAKACIADREQIEARLSADRDITIARHTVREQYDTYLLFAEPTLGRIRYREDNVQQTQTAGQADWNAGLSVAPDYRLTWIGPASEREYANSVILTRSRYDAPASRSLRFYREYFQPTQIVEIAKNRRRYHIVYRDLEFAVNLDQLIEPAGIYLEIKSRTWSAKDALHKAELIAELLGRLEVPASAVVRGEYVNIKGACTSQ